MYKMAGLIIYKGKYGATQQYADWIAREIDIPSYQATHENESILKRSQFIVLGSSVYVGKLKLAKWIQNHKDILEGKKIFLFIVCAASANEVRKRDEIVRNNISEQLLKHTEVFFLRGRMIKSQLSFTDGLILRMGAAGVKDAAEKKRMLTDFDDVKKENLKDLLTAIHGYLDESRKKASFRASTPDES